MATIRVLQGMRVDNGALRKNFAKATIKVPLLSIVLENSNPDPRFEEKVPTTIQESLPVGSKIVYIGAPSNYYGSIATVTYGMQRE